jgi:outer membrane protein assembly factor BamB
VVRCLCALLFLLLSLASLPAFDRSPSPRPGVDWPWFRGVFSSGVAEGFETPTSWSVKTSEGIAWKAPVPGLGHSSPVIWGNLVCVTTAIGGDETRKRPDPEHTKMTTSVSGSPIADLQSVRDGAAIEWRVICFDKEAGAVKWAKTAYRGIAAIGRHQGSTHANPTTATDGVYLVAFFGSEGLYCFRLSDGHLLWKKSFGVLDSGYFELPSWQWGFASSPIIYNGKVIVLCDVQKNSFLAALSVTNGTEIWRTPRRDVPTFGTPNVMTGAGRPQLVVNGWREVAGYDLETGKQRWSLDATSGGGDLPVPTPIFGKGLVFLTSSHGPGSPIYAIRGTMEGSLVMKDGLVEGPHVAWSRSRDGSYMQTPLFYRDRLYSVRTNGVLGVYAAETGEVVYQKRIASGAQFWASPVAAGGKVYFTSADGDVVVIKAGDELEVLAENDLGEVTKATPAISEGRLYFRTQSHLVAVDKQTERQHTRD